MHLLPDGTVKIFSRNSEDNSEKYPDLRDTVRRARVPEVVSCILDAEVVAYDREQKCLLPFQVLSTRKRKVEAGEEDTQKVSYYCYYYHNYCYYYYFYRQSTCAVIQ